MNFSSLDLATGRFTEISTYIGSRDVLSKPALQDATSRLISAWPTLTLRVNALRFKAYESPATSMVDEMISSRILESSIDPLLQSTTTKHGVAIRSCQPVADLFKDKKTSWLNFFCPRIAKLQAVIFRDGTIVKVTLQHVAGDTVGLHNVASAFCESLRGDVIKRTAWPAVRYQQKNYGEEKLGTSSPRQDMTPKDCIPNKASKARLPGVGYLYGFLTLLRSWWSSFRTVTHWQSLHVPHEVLECWRESARRAGASVSTFDLVAAWIHMCLIDDAKQRGMDGRERMIIAISLRSLLTDPEDCQSELRNPTGGVSIVPQTNDHSNQRERLIESAQNIRSQIANTRTPAFVQRLLQYMASVGTSPVTIRRQGCIDSPMMMLSSWGHVDFNKLSLRQDASLSNSEPILVQNELRYVQWLPTPWVMPQITCICHKGVDGSYWLEANLTGPMWDRILTLNF